MAAKRITTPSFLSEFVRRHELVSDRPYCWILGSKLQIPDPRPLLQKTHDARVTAWQSQFENLSKKINERSADPGLEAELKAMNNAMLSKTPIHSGETPGSIRQPSPWLSVNGGVHSRNVFLRLAHGSAQWGSASAHPVNTGAGVRNVSTRVVNAFLPRRSAFSGPVNAFLRDVSDLLPKTGVAFELAGDQHFTSGEMQ